MTGMYVGTGLSQFKKKKKVVRPVFKNEYSLRETKSAVRRPSKVVILKPGAS